MSVIIESQPLQPLEPVLRTWVECVRQYVAVWGGEDLPYWYNEQSNVSVLCGAAWRAGWTALEEYQVGRIGDEAEYGAGRNDLYIANDEHGFCIEAKVAYLEITDLTAAGTLLAARCALATADARSADIEGHKVGAVFAIPYRQGAQASQEEQQAFIDWLEEKHFAALAWVQPDTEPNLRSHYDRHYPLAALVLLNA